MNGLNGSATLDEMDVLTEKQQQQDHWLALIGAIIFTLTLFGLRTTLMLNPTYNITSQILQNAGESTAMGVFSYFSFRWLSPKTRTNVTRLKNKED